MEPLTAEKIGERIREIEQRVGRLSPLQKVLIRTDGTVTNLLEMATGHPVTITTRVQDVVAAGSTSGTSGIGTAAFEQGGFTLDGGHRFRTPGGKQEFRPSAASRGIAPPPVRA